MYCTVLYSRLSSQTRHAWNRHHGQSKMPWNRNGARRSLAAEPRTGDGSTNESLSLSLMIRLAARDILAGWSLPGKSRRVPHSQGLAHRVTVSRTADATTLRWPRAAQSPPPHGTPAHAKSVKVNITWVDSRAVPGRLCCQAWEQALVAMRSARTDGVCEWSAVRDNIPEAAFSIAASSSTKLASDHARPSQARRVCAASKFSLSFPYRQGDADQDSPLLVLSSAGEIPVPRLLSAHFTCRISFTGPPIVISEGMRAR